MFFKLTHRSSKTNARSGKIFTDRGAISTPTFMPVGTLGTVKGVHQHELENDIQAEIILSNTYHLYLRPGVDVINSAGGLNKFMNWNKPILTDSGGYQVFSLSKNVKIMDEGVQFYSHIDGSKHLFTPESVVQIQRKIGSDICMVLDECLKYPCEYSYASQSLNLTHNWLERSIEEFNKTEILYDKKQFLFPIVQGSTFKDLRTKSAEYVSNKNMVGNAIGGLSVGEPKEIIYENVDLVCNILPKDKPRYLMGVGTPENILECISMGVDMFDCVMPSRNGRNGMLFTKNGTINIKNKKWEKDFSSIDEDMGSVSLNYSKSYLRHLILNKEMLGAQIASIHNLSFYIWLAKEARKHIVSDTFHTWKCEIKKRINNRL
ncbi:MAG: tRNA guanosine(34) transglycosylase Tgt [Bacteroidota bacterium]|nr:tRNA guanosine(34) transglycosylase Tgt [Bacteroidota bacterium]